MSRLYAQLFIWFCGASLLTLVLTVIVSQRLADHSFNALKPDWPTLAQLSAQAWQDGGGDGLGIWADRLSHRGIDIALLDGERNLVARPMPPTLSEYLPALASGDDIEIHPHPDLTVVAVTVLRSDGAPLRFFAVRHLRPADRRPAMLLVVELFVSAVVIGIVGWAAARSISRPVEAVQLAARRVAQGDLGARVGEGRGARYLQRHDELGQLARDFDSMAERIQASVQQTRGLLQDISHELRSPLARLQLAVELAKSQSDSPHLERAQREVGRLDRIIGEVLALARLEAQMPQAGFEAIALDELAVDRIAELGDRAESRGVELSLHAEPLEVQGDRSLLARALDNLLDNAIKFSPAGATVALEVMTRDGSALLRVLDRGPGVAAHELDNLFRPFHRGENSHLAEGTGLGLAIVRRIADTHSGRVWAEARPEGGLIVNLALPLPPAAQAPTATVASRADSA